MAISRKLSDFEANNENMLGYYSRVSLDDIINNFIVGYLGDDKVIKKVPRHEVAFWAQRTVQEFSYDVLHSEKNIEIEVGPSRVIKLPADYVNYVSLTWVDSSGNERPILPRKTTTAGRAVAQDYNYDYIYDSNGDLVYADDSEGIKRFQDPAIPEQARRAAQDYYFGYFDDDDYSYYYYSYFGRRYGLDPKDANVNGSYVLDSAAGLIYLDQLFDNDTIVKLRYISDGLGDGVTLNGEIDFTHVFVPKLVEDAVYASILYNLSKLRPGAAGAASLYKKEASAKMRNAKIRLMNLKTTEMEQVMRSKSKWIKH